MKIAIFEPFIGGIGGSQKVIAELGYYLQSKGHHVEFFVQKYDSQTPYSQFNSMKINLLNPSSKILSPLVFLFKKVKGFDIIISSNFPSNFISIFNKPTFFICYSPRRYFYDLRKYSLRQASLMNKMILLIKILFFKKIDILSAKSAKTIVPISLNVKKRIEKYYGLKNTRVLYVGADLKNYYSNKSQDYVLCVSRLVDAKRVDIVAKSMFFLKNKRIKLYIIGDGPEEYKIKKLSEKNKNIILLGKVSEDKLKELYSRCLAAIYIPLDEDFGLIPVEAAASGKPTIGANEGGLKETVINGKTGILINNVVPEELAKKIDYLASNPKIAAKMGKAAKKYSQKFDWKYLLPKWEKEILKCRA